MPKPSLYFSLLLLGISFFLAWTALVLCVLSWATKPRPAPPLPVCECSKQELDLSVSTSERLELANHVCLEQLRNFRELGHTPN